MSKYAVACAPCRQVRALANKTADFMWLLTELAFIFRFQSESTNFDIARMPAIPYSTHTLTGLMQ